MNFKSHIYRFCVVFGLTFCLALINQHHCRAQNSDYSGIPSLVWPVLYDIQYQKARDAFGEYEKPVFSEGVKNMEGKEITIPGYMIPFEGSGQTREFMFSSLPLNACFFCGVGGPETFVQVRMSKAINYNDQPMEIRGRLKLNANNPDEHFYILEGAISLGTMSW